MLKSVLALVVLVHICSSQPCVKDVNVNREIISRLEKLHKLLQHHKVQIAPPGPQQVPDYSQHVCRCQGIFIKKLKHLLDTVSVPKEDQHLLNKLEGNLNHLREILQPYHLDESRCRLLPLRNETAVFEKYRQFLLRVNSSRGK